MEHLIYFDGAAGPGNPGNAAWGVWIPHLDKGWAGNIGRATNNTAEWEGAIAAIELAISKKIVDCEIVGDSQLVVYGVQYQQNTKAEHLQVLRDRSDTRIAAYKAARLGQLKWTWARREHNEMADRLSKLGQKLDEGVVVSYCYKATTDEFIYERSHVRSATKESAVEQKRVKTRLTKEILNRGKSRNGGFSARQKRLLGVSHNTAPNWEQRLIGKEYPAEIIAEFVALKDKHLPDLGGDPTQQILSYDYLLAQNQSLQARIEALESELAKARRAAP